MNKAAELEEATTIHVFALQSIKVVYIPIPWMQKSVQILKLSPLFPLPNSMNGIDSSLHKALKSASARFS